MNKKPALGRGLGALLQNSDTDITTKSIGEKEGGVVGSVSSIPIKEIETNPFQPRTIFDQSSLNDLAQSIKELGIIQPITLRKLPDDKYQLISGERRLRASQMVGLTTIPAFIRTANDQEMLEMAIVENIQRQELDPIEVALSYQRLLDECQQTQEQISQRLGKKRSTVSNFLRLLNLPPLIQAGLRDKMISHGHAKALLSITDAEIQSKAYKKIIAMQMSVRQAEELASTVNKSEKGEPKSIKKITQNDAMVPFIEQMHAAISPNVNIKANSKGKGKMIIDFENQDELERIINLICKS